MAGDARTAQVTVRLPVLIGTLFPDAERLVTMQAASVSEVMDELDRRWPGMRDCLCDSTPAVRRHINVFVNGRRVGLDHGLKPGEDIWILTAISGG